MEAELKFLLFQFRYSSWFSPQLQLKIFDFVLNAAFAKVFTAELKYRGSRSEDPGATQCLSDSQLISMRTPACLPKMQIVLKFLLQT